MGKTFWKKAKVGFLTLSTIGLLAACNTTDDFEENPEMGGDEAPVEDPAEMPSGGSGDQGGEGETSDN